MFRFLHIGFVWTWRVKAKELEPIFGGHSFDWVRYSPNCWIVWTDQTPDYWFDVLQPHLGAKDQVLIAELHQPLLNSRGWLSEFVWEWINRPR